MLGTSPVFATDAVAREGDLVANTDLLQTVWREAFLPLEDGLATMPALAPRATRRHSAH
jgi:hypothetical protein